MTFMAGLLIFYGAHHETRWMADFGLLVLISCLGTNYMSGELWTAGNDMYRHRIEFARAMPIPASVFAWSRSLFGLIAYLPNLGVLLIGFAIFARIAGQPYPAWPFVLSVMGLALMSAGLVALIEVTLTVKQYWLWSLVAVAVLMGGSFWVSFGLDRSLIRGLTHLAERSPAVTVGLSWVIGALGLVIFTRIASQRVAERALT